MKKTEGYSFKLKMNSALSLVTIIILMVLFIYNYFSFKEANERFLSSYQQSADLYVQTMQKDLKALDGFVSNIAVSDYNYLTLCGETTPLKAHLASHELSKQYRAALNLHSIAGAFFIYSEVNNTYRDVFSDHYDYAKKREMRSFMREITAKRENFFSQKWLVYEIGGVNYLFRILGKDGTYVATMVDFERFLSADPVNSDVTVAYATTDGVALTNREFIAENNIDLMGDLEASYFTGTMNKYLVLGHSIEDTDMNLLLMTTRPNVFSYVTNMETWTVLLSVLIIIIIVSCLFLLKIFLLSPLSQLIDGIQKDVTPQKPQKYSIDEFNQVDQKFSNLKNQISELEIIAYEKEIEKQKAELQYLQLQLRPHFFLNCLKNLYGMAQRQKTEEIQNMIVAISNHLRYNFKDNLELVPLSEEIKHVKNYMKIQQMALKTPPICEFHIDEKLFDFEVPPLLIQTFVENSVKYAMKPNKPLVLIIKAVVLQNDTGDYVDITVQDNGDGFAQAVLDDLNYNSKKLYAQNHIGVTNVSHRLNVLYGEKALLAFFNGVEGAVAEVLLPVEEDVENETENAHKEVVYLDEHFSC